MSKSKYANLYNPSVTPQSEPMNDRQVENNAGGFVFETDNWTRLDRFLILGSDAPTYYQTAKALTKENAKCVEACLAEDPERTIDSAVKVSLEGRAPKNDPAIFVLALAAVNDNEKARQAAYNAVGSICRTATHLMQFVDTARGLGKGFGRGMKRAVAKWYEGKAEDKLAFQLIKYRQREGYTHQRLMTMAHPSGGGSAARSAMYAWLRQGEGEQDGKGRARGNIANLPAIIPAHLSAMAVEEGKVKELLPLITEYRLPWEALPTWANTKPEVWEAMLPHLGLTALIRNLGNMTRVGAIKPLSKAEALIIQRLGDVEELKRARIHPFNVLQALTVYSGGHGLSGRGMSYRASAEPAKTWTPVQAIVDALNDAFYLSFKAVVPTGKRHLIGLDVSASMSSPIMGSAISCSQAAACMSLVTMNTEPMTHTMMFDQGMRPANISPRDRLDTATEKISAINGDGTDCSLPMLYALQHGLDVDAFVVYTDSETYFGSIHPVQALHQYRQKMGIAARLVVVAFTSNGFSIADPADGGMLDCVGFDSAGPAVIADFIRGRENNLRTDGPTDE